MSDGCDEVDRIVSLINFGDPHDVRTMIATVLDAERCITRGLERAAESLDWLTFEKYVVAAMRRPDRSMTEVLSRVFLSHVPHVNNDDIVDVLGSIADPRALPALADALIWEPDWDEFRHIARKATWALGRVGTEDARLLLQGAAETADEWVREAARYELNRWRPRAE